MGCGSPLCRFLHHSNLRILKTIVFVKLKRFVAHAVGHNETVAVKGPSQRLYLKCN